MGRILKKKKQKTKGRKPRETDSVLSTQTNKARLFKRLYLTEKEREVTAKSDYAKAEEKVVRMLNNDFKPIINNAEPNMVEVTELGSEKKEFIDIEGGGLLITSDVPDNETFRWVDQEMSDYEAKGTTGNLTSEQRYDKVDTDEIAAKIRQLHAEMKSEDVAKKFEEFGTVLNDAVKKNEIGHTYGEFEGYSYSDEMPEPAEDDYESDEDYFIGFDYKQNNNGPLSGIEPSAESLSFMYDIAQYLGYNEEEEMISDAISISLDDAFEIHRTQEIVNKTIQYGRNIMLKGGGYNSMKGGSTGRCESIW